MQATYFFRTIARVFHFSQIYLTTFSIIRKLMRRTECWTGRLVVWVIFMKIVLKAFLYVVFWLAGENIGHILFRISNLAHIGPLLLTHTHLITKSDLPCIALGTHTCPKGLTHTLTHTQIENPSDTHLTSVLVVHYHGNFKTCWLQIPTSIASNFSLIVFLALALSLPVHFAFSLCKHVYLFAKKMYSTLHFLPAFSCSFSFFCWMNIFY